MRPSVGQTPVGGQQWPALPCDAMRCAGWGEQRRMRCPNKDSVAADAYAEARASDKATDG
jgi:hypothetical protein